MKRLIINVLVVVLLSAPPLLAFGKNRAKSPDQLPPISEDIRAGENQARRYGLANESANPEQTEMRTRLQEMVKRIGTVSDIPTLPYEVHIVASEMANASCLPGGKVIFFTGLWDKKKGFVKKSRDEELAAVLAHEVAHAAMRHWARRTFTKEDKRQATYEAEADLQGMIYMARAGYNPAAMVRVFGRQAAHERHDSSGSAVIDSLTREWEQTFASHPNSKNRAQVLKEHLPEAMEIYRNTHQ